MMRLLLALAGVFRRCVKALIILVFTVSLFFNVAMLMVSGVYTAASAALTGIGITTAAARDARARVAQKQIVRQTAQRVKRRAQHAAARSIASAGGKAVPLAGIAVIAGGLALEVQDTCATAAEMAGLEAALASDGDAEAARQTAVDQFDCKAMIREVLPSYEDVPKGSEIWNLMKRGPEDAYDAARNAGISLPQFKAPWMWGRAESLPEDLLHDIPSDGSIE
ncbi:hypothetical protein [Poseidonocella sedimentorum]|uniref:Uncharacterized protein n=1 Tax=Poseidonocella sedimentorum TaxID=871652 RepID=A0A1I6E144_9RHOB|nr:hypothetical protein [Poseidonocella sedimentorum]SFR11238.1 hypothetical protein SAMN04515673_106176 [Poseidonocella sedimentorum]